MGSSLRSSAPDSNGWRTVGGYQAPVYSSLGTDTSATSNPFGRQQGMSSYSDSSPFGRKRTANHEMPSAFSSRRRTDQQESMGYMPSAFSSRGNQDNGGSVLSDRASNAFGERSSGSSSLGDRASNAFGGRPQRGPNRREEEAAYQQEAFNRKLAELEAKKAAETVDIADEDAFPTLGALPKPKKVAVAVAQPKAKAWHTTAPSAPPATSAPVAAEPAPAPPKNTWASKMRDWQDEDLIRQRQEAAAEAARLEDEVYIKLNTLDLSANKPSKPINPYLSNLYSEPRARIMEEQDAFDYNNEFHRADDLLGHDHYAPGGKRVYSPHSPPYPYYSDNDNIEDE